MEVLYLSTDVYAEEVPILQNYCDNCHRLLKDRTEECACDTGVSQFMSVPIGPQLKCRLEGIALALLCKQ